MDFYYTLASPPCHAVLMTAKALGVKLNLKDINMMKGEHMTPEYLKMNPQHTIPTLNDNGFYLWESRAIMVYLVEKYGKDSSLYPTDPQRQAVVNQRLNFDLGTLYQRFADYFYPQVMTKAPADPEKFKKLEDALGFLNTFLEGQKYAAGDDLTLADISLVASVSTMELIKDFDVNKYPNVARWFKLMKATVPGYSLNQEGIDKFRKFLN